MTLMHWVPVLGVETDVEGALEVVLEMETVEGDTEWVLVLSVDVKVILETVLGVETVAGDISIEYLY